MHRPLALTLLLLLPGFAVAADLSLKDPSLGEKVFWRSGARARIGTTEIHIEKVPFPATVEQIDGDWLWLERAWVNKQDVMSTDHALQYYSHRIKFNPINDIWFRRRSAIWMEMGEGENAVQDCNDAVRLSPRDAPAYTQRGLAAENLGEFKSALQDFDDAIELYPNYAPAYQARGALRLRQGDWDQAIFDFGEAFRLDINNPAAYLGRGKAWNSRGNFARAIQDFQHAVLLDPKSAEAYNALALLRASCQDETYRDGNKAINDASKACEISGSQNWRYLDTLAAAYAETGDFESAVKWQEHAVDMAKDDQGKQEVFQRLQLYRTNQPWRTGPKPTELPKAELPMPERPEAELPGPSL